MYGFWCTDWLVFCSLMRIKSVFVCTAQWRNEVSNCSAGLQLFSKPVLLVQEARNSAKEKVVISVLFLVHWQDCYFLCLTIFCIWLYLNVSERLVHWWAFYVKKYCKFSLHSSVKTYCLSLLKEEVMFWFDAIPFFSAKYTNHNSTCG